MIESEIRWPGGSGNQVGKDSRADEERLSRPSVDCFELCRRRCR